MEIFFSTLGILRRVSTFDISRNSYCCNLSDNGQYNVKSVYAFIEESNFSAKGEAGPSSNSKLKKNLEPHLENGYSEEN